MDIRKPRLEVSFLLLVVMLVLTLGFKIVKKKTSPSTSMEVIYRKAVYNFCAL
jgi:hypothetical protein